MLTNEAEFEVLLVRYEDEPGICSKILRTYSLTEPKAFLEYTQNALLQHPASRALKFITCLALGAGLMEQLLEMYVNAKPRCMQLARKLIACEARFDHIFLDFLLRGSPNDRGPGEPGEENRFHAGLDILDLISQGDRLVPGVLKILKHPNPKVRSKAAVFIGSRTQNVAWAASRTQEYDARVRANILESLFGMHSDFAHQIFRNNVADENNRVAGNAILGLYLLGDASSIPLIFDLLRHPDARFRNTCAWVMGRTGDPRFTQSLAELMKDSDELVRAQAFKGMCELRKALRIQASRPELGASIGAAASEPPAVLATVYHPDTKLPVRGIPATGFVLRSGSPSKQVRHYSVREFDGHTALTVAFVACLPEEGEAEATQAFRKAVEACSVLRRPRDRWAILKIDARRRASRGEALLKTDGPSLLRHKLSVLQLSSEEPAAAGPAAHRFEYANAQLRIDAMLRDAPVMLERGATDETRLLLDSLLRSGLAPGKPHLIFFGCGPEPHFIKPLLERQPDMPAVVHILGKAVGWRDPACRDLPHKTGGLFRQIDSYAEMERACFESYLSLLHHYRISWKEAPPEPVELDIRCQQGRASCSSGCVETPSVPLSA